MNESLGLFFPSNGGKTLSVIRPVGWFVQQRGRIRTDSEVGGHRVLADTEHHDTDGVRVRDACNALQTLLHVLVLHTVRYACKQNQVQLRNIGTSSLIKKN